MKIHFRVLCKQQVFNAVIDVWMIGGVMAGFRGAGPEMKLLRYRVKGKHLQTAEEDAGHMPK